MRNCPILLPIQESVLHVAGQKITYKFVGIVVHHPLLQNCAHYVSYFRSHTNSLQWFYCNDHQVFVIHCEAFCKAVVQPCMWSPQVLPVSAATVLQQQPYLLFYDESKQNTLPRVPLCKTTF